MRKLLFVLPSLILILLSGLLGCSQAVPPSTPAPAAPTQAAAPAPVSGTITLTLASSLPNNASPAIPADWWAKQVEQKSNGRVKFQYYWAGSLIKVGEELNAAQSGLADLVVINAPNYVDKLPLVNMELPVLFSPSDFDMNRKVYDLMFKDKDVLNDIERYGVKMLFPVSVESKDIASKRLVKTLADMKGLKIATIGAYLPKAMQAIGAVPVNVPAAERYQALQTGVVDASALGIGSTYGYKFNEVAKNVTLVGTGAEVVGMFVINNNSWNKLPADIQKLMTDLIPEAESYSVQDLTRFRDTGIKGVQDGGGTIYELPFEEKAAWANAIENYPAQWAKDLDAKGLPGTRVMKLYLDTCKEMGYKFPREYPLN